MAIATFLLGAILLACGLGALAWSVDLVPTEMGRLYAESGVIFISSSFVVLAIALLTLQIHRISTPRKKPQPAPAPRPVEAQPAPAPELASEEEEINLNRSGHLPSLHDVEDALAEPEAAPAIIGRYSAGGAQYVVYSDGAIEAETTEGGLRFTSMEDFKAYIASRKG